MSHIPEKAKKAGAWVTAGAILAVSTIVPATPQKAHAAKQGDKPNILVIWGDDVGRSNISAYTRGLVGYRTPNIDRIASEGMLFTDAYASCPVCSPTRASILTGKYPARVGVTQFIGGHTVGRLEDVPYFHQLPMSERSIARTLSENGYATWHVGKWHLGNGHTLPTKHGFDTNIAGCDWGMPQDGYFSPWNIETLENGEEGVIAFAVSPMGCVAALVPGSGDDSFPVGTVIVGLNVV